MTQSTGKLQQKTHDFYFVWEAEKPSSISGPSSHDLSFAQKPESVCRSLCCGSLRRAGWAPAQDNQVHQMRLNGQCNFFHGETLESHFGCHNDNFCHLVVHLLSLLIARSTMSGMGNTANRLTGQPRSPQQQKAYVKVVSKQKLNRLGSLATYQLLSLVSWVNRLL